MGLFGKNKQGEAGVKFVTPQPQIIQQPQPAAAPVKECNHKLAAAIYNEGEKSGKQGVILFCEKCGFWEKIA